MLPEPCSAHARPHHSNGLGGGNNCFSDPQFVDVATECRAQIFGEYVIVAFCMGHKSLVLHLSAHVRPIYHANTIAKPTKIFQYPYIPLKHHGYTAHKALFRCHTYALINCVNINATISAV